MASVQGPIAFHSTNSNTTPPAGIPLTPKSSFIGVSGTAGMSFHASSGDSGTYSSPPSSIAGSDYSYIYGPPQTSFKSSFDVYARPLLDTIDLIRSLGLEGRDFQLPKIVVTGDQSVGKSSCLEAFSGIQLPRGDGIVTRTPLEMRLRTSRNGTPWRCRIRYTDQAKTPVDLEISSPVEVAEAVRTAQGRITGDNAGISDSLITLDVESPDVPDLTLIDLPGIARYSEANAQIEQQIIQLIKKFVKPEHTIILAVFPAGTDVDTVAAFRLARDVDPELKRTMGVITKMDLVGPGSEKYVMETLSNKKMKLKLGIFAVKCRSQDEIERGIPLPEACQKEEDFFHNHPHFGNLNASIFGVRRLSEKMVKELTNRIKESLPGMNQIVSENLSRIKNDISDLGKGPSDDEDERRREFLGLLTEYTDIVEKVSCGLYRHENDKIKLFSMWRYETHVFAGKIREVTIQGVTNSLQQDEGILQTLRMQRGSELPGFVNSFPVCESIISRLLVDWSGPARDYVAAVRNHVESVLRELASVTFQKFPNLAVRVKEIVDERLQIAIESTESDIKKIFSQESIVWTQDETYQAQREDIKKNPEKAKLTVPVGSEPEDQITGLNRIAEDVMEGVSAYMEVACRRIMDTIPQSVLYHSLRVLSAEIKEYVLSIAANSSELNDLFQEREEIATRREELMDLQKRWRKAEKQLAAL